jgi:glutamine synthetase
MVMCDVLDHHTHKPVPHSPRADAQDPDRAAQGPGPYRAMMATELEFFLFEQSFDELRKFRLPRPEPISGYNEDYHILQTTKEEG